MNWYKKATFSDDFKKSFFGLSLPIVALLLGVSVYQAQQKIEQDPQGTYQEVQQVMQKRQIEEPSEYTSIEEPLKQEEIVEETVEENKIKSEFSNEYDIIINAAKRNNLALEDYPILFAIRRVENGAKNREFGIINEKADRIMKERPDKTLDIQAGWAAATIKNNRERWENEQNKELYNSDFIEFLGSRYAPTTGKLRPAEKKLNPNWIRNIKYWIGRLK
jgi:hypothetical protein